MQIFHSCLRLYIIHCLFSRRNIFSKAKYRVWAIAFVLLVHAKCEAISDIPAAYCRCKISEIFFMRSLVIECSWCR